MKVWTKVEVDDAIGGFGSTADYEYQISIEIHAWEHYDEECDIDHENWTKYNENFEEVAEVFGGIREGKAYIWVTYGDESYKDNLMIRKAISKAEKDVKEDLENELQFD